MERLTEQERNNDGTGISKHSLIDRPGKGYPSSYCRQIITKLADYEDLEEECIRENTWSLKILLKKWKEFFEDIQELYEYRKLKKQGKLLKLPCKVGDIVYQADNYMNKVNDAVVNRIEVNQEEIWIVTSLCSYRVSSFGRTVFLTKEEAEQALKERKNC